MNIKNLEKIWVDNFKRSPLVRLDTGTLDSEIAKQLYFGKHQENYPAEYPENISGLCRNAIFDNKEENIASLLSFLHFAGLNISLKAVEDFIENYPQDYQKLFRKASEIFKTFAHYQEKINIENPYADNLSELYFFLTMEMGENPNKSQLKLFPDIELPELFRRNSLLPQGYENDEIISNLFHEIETTKKSFFITGKAGTGKSTFIQYFAKTTKKKVILTAFTGIAAINVGGQTLHSFFKFPIKPLLPGDHEIPIFKKNSQNRKIIEKIDTIVIDEVSMLRADVLEAIDFSLRVNGGNRNLPFGGKQVIFVGDVFQLPPVVDITNEVERVLFSEVFENEYFFGSKAYKNLNPVYFEFKKVHRQKDDIPFMELLDKVRLCTAEEEVLKALNARHYPRYQPTHDDFVITLTTNNYIANYENTNRLNELNYTPFCFEAEVDGEFREDRYPTAKSLILKKKAQIIFIKNDLAGRWVNGTIGKVEFISDDNIEVKLQNGDVHKLEKTVWENRRYNYRLSEGKIVSELVGKFVQYPIKLAWAITIHKSQGLTFDKVVIDMGTGAFVNGQTYTALSRCRSLKGIALKKLIKPADIIADERIIAFHNTEQILHSIEANVVNEE